ncbi:MAG: toxin HicA [Dehalococcoidia bacterium]|nr:toxin HicA [Dehalococcoidia bacterium]
MSKQEKREQKIRKNPTNVLLEDFEALINSYGYIKSSGSHPKARIGNYTLPYKRENPVKPIYVKELLKVIDSL